MNDLTNCSKWRLSTKWGLVAYVCPFHDFPKYFNRFVVHSFGEIVKRQVCQKRGELPTAVLSTFSYAFPPRAESATFCSPQWKFRLRPTVYAGIIVIASSCDFYRHTTSWHHLYPPKRRFWKAKQLFKDVNTDRIWTTIRWKVLWKNIQKGSFGLPKSSFWHSGEQKLRDFAPT